MNQNHDIKGKQRGPKSNRILVAIHGVGDSPQGEISSVLAETVNELMPGSRVREIHWNSWVDRPDPVNGLHWYVRRLSGAIIGCICQPVIPRQRDLGAWPRTVGRLVEWMAPLCALLVPFPLYILVLLLWGYSLLESTVWMSSILLGLFTTGALLGTLSLNREIFWGSIRVGLLPGLWVPLGVAMGLTCIQWGEFVAMITAGVISHYWITSMYPGLDFLQVNMLLLTGVGPNVEWWVRPLVVLATIPVSMLVVMAVTSVWMGLYDRTFYGVTKVLGDIFFYLGSADYREEIISKTRTRIDDILRSGVQELVLCAHSLGTVVSIDALCKIKEVRNPQKIILVSAGSPLRRIFWRFFPALFPPPHEIARLLHRRHHQFCWVNVYRPFDYIGGSLDLNPMGKDLCTRQRWPLHVNYWGDEVPVKLVIRTLSEPGTVGEEHVAGSCNEPAPSHSSALLVYIKKCLSWAVLVALVSAIPAIVLTDIYKKDEQRLEGVQAYASAPDKRRTLVTLVYLPESDINRRMIDLSASGDRKLRALDRGLHYNLPNSYLVDTYALGRKVMAEGWKGSTSQNKPRFELWVEGTEVESKPGLFTVAEVSPPNVGRIRGLMLGLIVSGTFIYFLFIRRYWEWLKQFVDFFFAND